MRRTIGIVLGLVLSLVVAVLAMVVDGMVRSHFGGPMKIEGLPIRNASVTGAWNPDFLWIGKAWRIEVRSDEALELELDGRKYVLPKGSSKIYSNHDSTNTGDFGDEQFWGYPTNVEIHPLGRKS